MSETETSGTICHLCGTFPVAEGSWKCADGRCVSVYLCRKDELLWLRDGAVISEEECALLTANEAGMHLEVLWNTRHFENSKTIILLAQLRSSPPETLLGAVLVDQLKMVAGPDLTTEDGTVYGKQYFRVLRSRACSIEECTRLTAERWRTA